MKKTISIFCIFAYQIAQTKDDSDIETSSYAALTMGVLSLLILLTLTFAGVIVPTLLSLVMGISSIVQARRVVKNGEATSKQRRRARLGLMFGVLSFVTLAVLVFWVFINTAG